MIDSDQTDYNSYQDLSPKCDWLKPAIMIGGLITLGVILTFSGAMSRVAPGASFSAKISYFYCPIAALIIFVTGWTNFPLAAALFYGYLGLAQATNSTYFVLGNHEAALTMDSLFAVPLIFVGLLSPPASNDGLSQKLPSSMKIFLTLIFISAVLSTLFAASRYIAVATFLHRFALPILVTVVCFRKLKNINDYKIIWIGFVIGMLAIAVFDFRRAVLGAGGAVDVSQRFLGATMSFAIPALYIIGGLLWMGFEKAESYSLTRGMVLMLLAGLFGILIYLSGSRGTFVGFLLLLLWCLPAKSLKVFLKPQLFIFFAIGGLVISALVFYSLRRTALDPGLVLERLSQLKEQGLTGSNRWPIWVEGTKLWAQKPLFGQGLNSWVVFNKEFASVHGTVVGILLDTGLFGMFAFSFFFSSILYYSRRRYLKQMNSSDQAFFIGLRNGWIVMMLILSVNLPFTSGQPRNFIFSYIVYFFPLLVMTNLARPDSEYMYYSEEELDYEYPDDTNQEGES